MRREKPSNPQVDIEALAQRVVELLREGTGNIMVGSAGSDPVHRRNSITMDESIIPTELKVEVGSVNLDNVASSTQQVDKDLEKSKSRLASLKKGK